jgi:hypothetical protein
MPGKFFIQVLQVCNAPYENYTTEHFLINSHIVPRQLTACGTPAGCVCEESTPPATSNVSAGCPIISSAPENLQVGVVSVKYNLRVAFLRVRLALESSWGIQIEAIILPCEPITSIILCREYILYSK